MRPSDKLKHSSTSSVYIKSTLFLLLLAAAVIFVVVVVAFIILFSHDADDRETKKAIQEM